MKVFYRRNLPHYQPGDGIYFITFRLAGSIPVPELKRMIQIDVDVKRKSLTKKSPEELIDSLIEIDEIIHKHIWETSILHHKKAAEIVYKAIRFHDKRKYDLLSLCVMPNHGHILVKPYQKGDDYFSLEEITHSIKSYSASAINKELNRSGKLWAAESFDHYCRDENSVIRIIR